MIAWQLSVKGVVYSFIDLSLLLCGPANGNCKMGTL